MPDEKFDLVVVGSGGGGLVAALAAHEAGLRAIVLEKQEVVGGSTAMSGGVVWMPDNPLMREEGVPDSLEQGMTYLQSVVGDPDQPSSLARRRAFLAAGPAMLSFIRKSGVQLVRCEGYADYYDNVPGGNARGRSVEGVPWDGTQLGDWHQKINPGMARGMGLAVRTNETRTIATAFHRIIDRIACSTARSPGCRCSLAGAIVFRYGVFAEYGTGLCHSRDLNAFLYDCDGALLKDQQSAGCRSGA